MIHHVTQRCALIRMCREVSRAVAIAMDKNAVAKFCSQGLVCVSDLCSKACRPLTTSASRPRSVRMVSSPCAHQWPLLDGIGECSPPLAVSCLCYNTSSSAWMCNHVYRVYVSLLLSSFIVLEI